MNRGTLILFPIVEWERCVRKKRPQRFVAILPQKPGYSLGFAAGPDESGETTAFVR
jgi:hypothetical protein